MHLLFLLSTAYACTFSTPSMRGRIEVAPDVWREFERRSVTLTVDGETLLREVTLHPKWVVSDRDARVKLARGPVGVEAEDWKVGTELEVLNLEEPGSVRVRSTWPLAQASTTLPCTALALQARPKKPVARLDTVPARRLGPMELHATADPTSQVVATVPADAQAVVVDIGVDSQESHEILLLGPHITIRGFVETLGEKAPRPNSGTIGSHLAARHNKVGRFLHCRRPFPVSILHKDGPIELGSWSTSEAPLVFTDAGSLRKHRANSTLGLNGVSGLLTADLRGAGCRLD